MMSKNEEKRECKKMTITIRGHEVILNFAEKANPQVATQVKQALLGTYLLTARIIRRRLEVYSFQRK